MNHPTLEELLEIRDGEGTAEAAAHVESCASCAAEIARLREVASALRSLPQLEPPRNQWPEVRAAVEGEERAWIPRAVAGTLVALAASLIIVAILPREPGPQSPGREQVEMAPITDEEIAELVRESQRLERILRRDRPEGRVIDGWRANTVADLEERIALIDAELAGNGSFGVSRRSRARLWRTRVGLMNELVRARSPKPVYVEF